MSVRMNDFLPKHHSEILLSFEEYVDTWSELIGASRDNILADTELVQSLELADKDLLRLSIESTLLLCFDAMRTWKARRRVSDALKQRLEDALVYDAGMRYMGKQAAKEFLTRYQSQVKIFNQLMPQHKNGAVDITKELAGVARYLAFRCSKKDESECIQGVQRLGTHLVQAHALFERLNQSSIPDGNTLFSKRPRFIVRGDL